MTSYKDLYNFIHSMTKSEKRYFKLAVSVQKGEKNYIKLFDFIAKQKQCDSKKIYTAFKGAAFLKQLHVTINQLQQLILKNLQRFNSKKNASEKTKNLIAQATIMWQKGFSNSYIKMLLKAKSNATDSENFEQLLEIIFLEMHTLSINSENLKKLAALMNEQATIMKLINEISYYRYLSEEIFALYVESGQSQNPLLIKKYDKIIEKVSSRKNKLLLSCKALYYKYYSYALYYFLKFDYKKSLSFRLKIVDLFETNPDKLWDGIKGTRYFIALSNLLSMYTLLIEETKSETLLKKIKHLNYESMPQKAKIVSAAYINLLNMYLLRGFFKEAHKFANEYENESHLLQSNIPTTTKSTLYFNLFYTYFGNQEYHKALVWMNKIINDTDKTYRTDIYSSALIANMILHFELGNNNMLEHLFHSTYRYFSKKELLNKSEMEVLRFIKKVLSKSVSKKNIIYEFEKIKKSLEKLFQNKGESEIEKSFSFISWLDSKIQNRPFAEMVKEKTIKQLKN